MARNPLKQLQVIEKAAANKRIIKDCYRLLYRERLWEYVNEMRGRKRLQATSIRKMIQQVKDGTVVLHEATSEHLLLVDIITFILEKLYAHTIKTRTAVMRKVKETCDKKQRYITFSLHGFSKCLCMHSIHKKIQDPRFIQLVKQILQCKILHSSPKIFQLFAHITYIECTNLLKKEDRQVFHFRGQFLLNLKSSEGVQEEIIRLVKKNRLQLQSLNLFDLNRRIRYLDYDINMNRYVRLEIPFEKVNQFARLYDYGYFTPFTITHRANIAYKKELEIVKIYNRELRNIASYYSLACNQYELKKLFYLAESSFIKTIAYKRRTTSKKAIKSMRKYKQGYLTIIHKHKPGHFISESFIKWKERHD